jgi:hypothetical protein
MLKLVVTASGTQRHHRSAGQRAARPQAALVVTLAQAAAAAPELLDLKIADGMAGIREFNAKPLKELLARQGRGGHFTGTRVTRARRLWVNPCHTGHRNRAWHMHASRYFDTMTLTDCKISKGNSRPHELVA